MNKHKLKNSRGNPTSPLEVLCSMSRPSEIFRNSFLAVPLAKRSLFFAVETKSFSAFRDRRVKLGFWYACRMTFSAAFIESIIACPRSRAGPRKACSVLPSSSEFPDDELGNAIPQESSRRIFSIIPIRGLIDFTVIYILLIVIKRCSL